MRYFVQTTHCPPNAFSLLGFKEVEDGLYSYSLDGSFWKERYLADMGWGRERGLYRLPELNFEQLISLVLIRPISAKTKWYHKKTEEEIKREKDDYHNFWGSLAVLLDDYCDKFVEYIALNFTPKQLATEYPELYDYTNSELDLPVDFCKKISDKSFVTCCEKWKKWLNGINQSDLS